MRVLRRGDTGPAVAEVRATLAGLGLLPAEPAGPPERAVYDPAVEHAVSTFQQQRGLITDGVVGPATYRALKDATYQLGARPLAYLVSSPVSGDDVATLQERLLELGFDAGRPNGVFGAQTEAALRQLSPRARGGSPVLLREQERVRRAGPRLRGKRIVIDPGHGGQDRGVTVAGVQEAELVWDLARRLEGKMAATGMQALLSRGPDQCPSEADRAHFANEVAGDLFLSLHADANRSQLAQGVASFHFGTITGNTSTIGETLAGFIQRELVVRTGLRDCRAHRKTWDTLRLTRCPAVRVEIGYLTNADDRRRLSDPAFRDVVAEGILVAVKRLYLLGENDQPTGTFTFADVLRHELAKAE